MATYNWKNGDSGNWGTAGDWQQDAVPDSTTADVTIGSATDIGVTIAAGQTFTADSVTLDSAGVTLQVRGLLNLGGAQDALFVNAGTLDVTAGGTIANGTIDPGNGVVSLSQYATLDDITYVGNFALTGDFDSIYVEGGLQVVNPNGGAASLTVSGQDTNIYFASNQSFNDIGITLAGDNGLIARDGTGSRGKTSALSFGSATTINSTGSGGFNYIFGSTVLNAGIINAGGSGLLITSQTTFTNAGTLNIYAGADVLITTDVLDNTGVINVAAGSELGISERAASDNGVINADGTIQLDYSTTLAGLNSINWGTASQLLVLEGDLNIGGGTLAIGGDDNILIEYGGEVSNGTLNSNLGTLTVGNGAVLSDITFIGPINLTPSYDILRIYNGFTLLNSSGDGPGTISLTGLRDQLFFTTSKLDNAVINVTGYLDDVYLDTPFVDNVGINLGVAHQKSDAFVDADNTTFGSHTTINSTGTQFNSLYGDLHSRIVNDGIINIAGRGLALQAPTFTNADTINISAGSEAFVQSRIEDGSYVQSTFTNTGLIEGTGAGVSKFTTVPYPNGTPDIEFKNLVHGVLTAGGFEANPGNTLKLDLSGQVITTDDGVLILNGKGSQIKEFQASTDSYVALQSTLRNIGPGGEFEVLGGRDFTTGNKLRIAGGTLALGGGTFSAAGLDLATGGSRITGFGTLKKGLTNNGVIEADGGTLVIAGALHGAGSLQIDGHSTLELVNGTAENVSFAGSASSLILEAPALFTGLLGGIAAGDSIGLAGETASSASLSGSSLLVTLTNSTVLDYTLASALPMEGVSVSNSASGAELTFYQLPAAAAAPEMSFMAPFDAPEKAAHARPASLPPLQDLWSDATQYRPFFMGRFGAASVINPQHLQGRAWQHAKPRQCRYRAGRIAEWGTYPCPQP
jgi:hypothetical protein